MVADVDVSEQSPLAAFLEWDAAEPNAIAVECCAEHDGQERKLTVHDVYCRAARLAKTLLDQAGSKQDDVVGLQIELESELYVAFFACWMAGRLGACSSS
jgi:acyl-CoA synthetase (AMP-forming)/AMP-acid ligase II